jgi:ribonuclease VapC
MADGCRISAASFVESSIVIAARFGAAGLSDLDRLVERAGIETVAVDLQQARAAREAFMRFGKGRHPAGLNFADCFSYALARTLGEPLLFKGEDFARTDIVPFDSSASA